VAFSGYKIQRKKAERGERAYGKKRTQGEEKNRGGGETKKREKKSEGASIHQQHIIPLLPSSSS
jgi:hypothetical protein